MPSILITGATGFLGSTIVAKFLAERWDVTVLSRDPKKAHAIFPPQVSALTLSNLMTQQAFHVDAVIHLAGASIAGGLWTRRRKGVLWRSRIEGTRSLVTALSRLAVPPSVFVSASGMGYYGHRGGDTVSVSDAPGEDFLGRMAAAWEAEITGATDFGARVAMLRLGMVLGRGGGALPPLALSTRLGLGAVLGDGQQYWPWIHRDDAAGLFYQAVTDTSISGPLHGAVGAPITQRAFAKTLASVLHRPLLWRVPAFALRMGLLELSDLFLHGQRVEPDARFVFQYPTLEDALRQAC
jgi:uncharacterized protein